MGPLDFLTRGVLALPATTDNGQRIADAALLDRGSKVRNWRPRTGDEGDEARRPLSTAYRQRDAGPIKSPLHQPNGRQTGPFDLGVAPTSAFCCACGAP